jgi:hypothetical protein
VPANETWRRFWRVFAVAMAANTVLLIIDHKPLFILGDSMVYVGSAFTSGGPGDRSFAYGHYLVRPLLWMFRSLDAVVVAQAVMSSCTAAMLAAILDLGLGVRRWIAIAAAVAYIAEPLALLYQRMMMTEAPALFFLALFLLLGIVYLRRPRLWLLCGLAAVSVACVAFRVSLLPVLLVSIVILPPLAVLRQWKPPRAMLARCATHLLFSLGLTISLHGWYQHLFHNMTGQPPAYNSADGFFLLAAWAPLVTRADFPDPALFDRILPTLGSPLADRFARPGHRFSPDGLIARLIESQQNDDRAANALAKRITVHAALRDPVGVLLLGWHTYLDFWDQQVMTRVLQVDEGLFEADTPMIELFRSRYHEDISGRHLDPTFVKWWHGRAMIWYRVVLLTPLVWLAALILRPRCWRAILLLGLSATGLLLVDTLLVTEPVVRYLHSIAWLTILFCGAIVEGLCDVFVGVGRPEPADARAG